MSYLHTSAYPATTRIAGFRPAGPAPMIWFFVLLGSLVATGLAATSMIEHAGGRHYELTQILR